MGKNAAKRTHCELLIDLLRDGRWHSTSELLRSTMELTGEGMTVHSRVSQLRGRGVVIQHRHVGGEEGARAHEYRLVSVPLAAPASGVSPAAPASSPCLAPVAQAAGPPPPVSPDGS